MISADRLRSLFAADPTMLQIPELRPLHTATILVASAAECRDGVTSESLPKHLRTNFAMLPETDIPIYLTLARQIYAESQE